MANKRSISFLLVLILILSLSFTLFSCDETDGKAEPPSYVGCITDFSWYRDMTGRTDKIDAFYYVGDAQFSFAFTIENEEDIAEIMDYIFHFEYEIEDVEMNGVTPFSSVRVYQGENQYNIGYTAYEGEVRYVRKNNEASNAFSKKIQELALAKSKSITDFSEFDGMTRTADKIEIDYWDIDTDSTTRLTVENQEDIAEIMDIIFTETHYELNRAEHLGNSHVIYIYQGEKIYSLRSNCNLLDGSIYTTPENDLNEKILALAEEAGLR